MKDVNHKCLWYGSEAAKRFFATTGADPKPFWKIRKLLFYIPRAKPHSPKKQYIPTSETIGQLPLSA